MISQFCWACCDITTISKHQYHNSTTMTETGLSKCLQLINDGCDILSPRPESLASASILCESLISDQKKSTSDGEILANFLRTCAENVGWNHVVGEACQAGHTEAVEWLLQNRVHERENDINLCGSIIDPLLHKAVYSDNPVMVQLLLRVGIDINMTNDNQENALHVACHNSSIKSAKLLIQASIDINARDYAKRTPLFIASNRGLSEIVLDLINKGADVTQSCGRSFDWFSNFTPLHIAAQTNEVNVMKILLENGAPLEARDRFGNTPLLTAVESSNCSAIQCLLEQGCNPHASCHRTFNALFKACFLADCKQVLNLLLGSNLYDGSGGINSRGPCGMTLLMLASSVHVKMSKKDDRAMLLSYLLKAGADPKICMRNEYFPFTALGFCVLGYNYRMEGKCDSYPENIVLLVRHTPDPNVPCLVDLTFLELQSFPFKLPNDKIQLHPPAFYSVKNCMLHLAKILYTAGAHISRDWLKECIHSDEYKYCQQSESLMASLKVQISDLSAWVCRVTRVPRSLSEMCRFCVRNRLPPPMDLTVNQLPVPDALKHYLMLPELREFS